MSSDDHRDRSGNSVNTDGWNEYSRLVLKELETLGHGIESLRSDLQGVRGDISKIQVRLDTVDELKTWKKNVEEVTSVTQLKELVKSVEDLKSFKIKAVTIFTVVQFLMAGSGLLIKYMA